MIIKEMGLFSQFLRAPSFTFYTLLSNVIYTAFHFIQQVHYFTEITGVLP